MHIFLALLRHHEDEEGGRPMPVRSSYHCRNAWRALELIHQWDATPLLPIVLACARERPSVDAIRALERYSPGQTEWSAAQLTCLLNDLVYDGRVTGFLKGFEDDDASLRFADDDRRERRRLINELHPSTLARLLEFAINEFEWQPPRVLPWWIGGNGWWHAVRAHLHAVYERRRASGLYMSMLFEAI